jgi:hypothetical protein
LTPDIKFHEKADAKRKVRYEWNYKSALPNPGIGMDTAKTAWVVTADESVPADNLAPCYRTSGGEPDYCLIGAAEFLRGKQQYTHRTKAPSSDAPAVVPAPALVPKS